MTWTVLVNPAAGRFAVDETRLASALERAGVDARIRAVIGRDRMREAVLDASSDRRVAVVGGDGTVSLAVDALLTAGVDPLPVLGILPSGTGCDLIRTFGIPQRLEDAAHHLTGDRTYRIDVGVLEGEWGRRHFVNVAQAGVGAAAAESAPRLPRWIGSVRYPLAFLARLPRFPRCLVEMDAARSYQGSALAVILANAQFFAGGWNVAPKAMLVDGEIDVQVIDTRKRKAPALVPKIIRGVHLTDPAVRRRSLGSLELRTEVPWPVEADGDYVGTTPVRVSVIPAAIEVKI